MELKGKQAEDFIKALEESEKFNEKANNLLKEKLEGKKEQLFVIGSGISNQDLVCSDCERVIFIGKKLGNVAEINADKIAKVDSIEVNGIKFRREV